MITPKLRDALARLSKHYQTGEGLPENGSLLIPALRQINETVYRSLEPEQKKVLMHLRRAISRANPSERRDWLTALFQEKTVPETGRDRRGIGKKTASGNGSSEGRDPYSILQDRIFGSGEENEREAYRRILQFIKDRQQNGKKTVRLDLSGLHLIELPECLFTDPEFADADVSGNPILFVTLPETESIQNRELYRIAKNEAVCNMHSLRSGSTENMTRRLGIDDWITEGNKEGAVERILDCFRCDSIHLNLEGFDLSSLPPKLQKFLPQLLDLDLSHNRLTSFDTEIGKNVKNLNLSNNQLVSFIVRDGKQLKTLNLNNNELTEFYLKYGNRLQHLELNNNKLPSFRLTHTESLTILLIQNNRLRLFFLANPAKLEILDLSHNELPEFRLEGAELLENLFLQDNQLSSFYLDTPKLLEVLLLQNNKLSSFLMQGATRLQMLFLQNNLLESFDLKGARRLEKLDLRSNRLEKRPEIESGLVLESCDFEGNPFFEETVGAPSGAL